MDPAELLDLAVEAHARRRWDEITRFRAAASITGAILAMKGTPGRLDDVVLWGPARVAYSEAHVVDAGTRHVTALALTTVHWWTTTTSERGNAECPHHGNQRPLAQANT
jgi:hypothetical protein